MCAIYSGLLCATFSEKHDLSGAQSQARERAMRCTDSFQTGQKSLTKEPII